MNFKLLFGGIFFSIGLLFGGIGLWSLFSTYSFTRTALVAEGEVMRGQGRAIVRFKTEWGEAVEFTSSVSTDPPRYQRGERVTVLYDRNAPQKAQIKSFTDNWFLGTIFSGFGLVFGGIGALFLIAFILRRRLIKYVKSHGMPIQAPIERVSLNRCIAKNSKHPHQIVCQWHDPFTNLVYTFKSENIWYNPEQFISERKNLTVYIDRRNPKKYWVDTSFLPKSA